MILRFAATASVSPWSMQLVFCGRPRRRALFRLEANEALSFVSKLWNVFIQDLVDPENDLPDVLRADLISVGLWIVKEAALIRSSQSQNYRGIADVCADDPRWAEVRL